MTVPTDTAKAVERLTASFGERHRQVPALGQPPVGPYMVRVQEDDLRTVLARLSDLEAANKRLIEALRPFAAMSDDDPDQQRTKRMQFIPITVLRTAAALLKELEP